RQCDREREFGDGLPEIVADRNEHERDEKEIERIERPAKETGDERIPLIAIQNLEKTNCLQACNPIEHSAVNPERIHSEALIVDLVIAKHDRAAIKCHVERSRDISKYFRDSKRFLDS